MADKQGLPDSANQEVARNGVCAWGDICCIWQLLMASNMHLTQQLLWVGLGQLSIGPLRVASCQHLLVEDVVSIQPHITERSRPRDPRVDKNGTWFSPPVMLKF